MKKVLAAALIVSLLLLPLAGVAMATGGEAPFSHDAEFVPGEAPAQSSAWESMTPALHAVVLALLNHGQTAFDPADPAVAWESLYNMLSLYGQLDEYAARQDDCLVVPSESVMNYAAALLGGPVPLGSIPAALDDRMTYDPGAGCCWVVCGEDGLAEIRLDQTVSGTKEVSLSGTLVYLADGSALAQFQAVLTYADNMFGCVLTSLELTAP